ncbi:unnamed protein product [Zymoseptoria tritici ST99CH_1A5]|uniref:Uncharacterized protein n=1 Tax=Zymoseptoria tritici ST99CH_1A5 TaxID=1276529 RepID=A0A1Y6M364_ZYMTR|nr:unnamed protein product [Zymoseptoria tritici ST99CH_1A5]
MARAKTSPEEIARRAKVEQDLVSNSITRGAWMLAILMRVSTTVPAGFAYAITTNILPNGLCIPMPQLLDNPTSHGFWPTLPSLIIILLIYAAVSSAQGAFVLWASRPSYGLRFFFYLAPSPETPPPTPVRGVARQA